MSDTSKRMNRRQAAVYWATHPIEDNETAEVAVEVSRPLSTILSIRLDEEHLSKLKSLAKVQEIGVTTMARKLLNQVVDNPSQQLLIQALEQETARTALTKMFDDARIPPGDGDPVYFLFSKDHLEQLAQLVNETALRLILGVLQERSYTVTPQSGEIYDKIKQLIAPG